MLSMESDAAVHNNKAERAPKTKTICYLVKLDPEMMNPAMLDFRILILDMEIQNKHPSKRGFWWTWILTGRATWENAMEEASLIYLRTPT